MQSGAIFYLSGILQYDCTESKKRGKIGQEKQDWRKDYGKRHVRRKPP